MMAHASTSRAVVTRAPSVSWCDLGDEIVVLRVRDNAYYRLQHSARDIWLELDRPRVVSELIEAIRDLHDGTETEIAAETTAFLEACVGLELVTVEGPGA